MLALMSPWIVGFSVFLLYPLVMNVYLSLTHYDLLNPPRWIGLANYRYAFTNDPNLWPAIKNTLWIIAVGVPLQVLFAFGIAMMLTRARAGRRRSSAPSSTCRRWCPRSRRRSASSTSSTRAPAR